MGGKRGRGTKIALAILILLAVFIILPISFVFIDPAAVGNVALIPINGPIVTTSSPFADNVASSQTIVEYIKQANENEQIKAIVFEINSPGGSAVASDEIAHAISKTNKPTVAHIREVGASGGYWIAAATDYIVTNRMSITGSIGVISSYLEFSGLMQEYGVGYERLVSGDKKDLGTPLRKLTIQERSLLQQKINKIHEYFVEHVSKSRNLSPEKTRALATGEFYLGVEALELGLVDQLGNDEQVKLYLKKKGIDHVEYVPYESPPGFLSIFSQLSTDFSSTLGASLAQELTTPTIKT